MDYTTLLDDKQGGEMLSLKDMPTFYEVCQQIEDKRKARGKRYDLAGLLVILVAAKLAGMSSMLGASEWAKDQEEGIRRMLSLPWKRMPCANTYSQVLAQLDSRQVNAHFAAWFLRVLASKPKEVTASAHVHLAIDGKTLKSTGTQTYGGDHPQQHVLHVYEVETGIVLEQIPVGTKTNEVGALKPFLTEVLCKGRVLTADAAQSYHEMPRLVKRAGGDVILIIKNNTPQTRADLELFFEDPQADRSTWREAQSLEKGHGRLEQRTLLCSPDLNGLFFREWGELGQVFRIQRQRTIKGETSCEVRYGLTTLSMRSCPPEQLLGYLRAHWKVENHLHWSRDALLAEDRCRVRCIPVMEVLAVLNSAVLSFMRVHQISTIARQLRRFGSHPREAFSWLLSDF
jgi:predicted transposase YbfD/YdcC